MRYRGNKLDTNGRMPAQAGVLAVSPGLGALRVPGRAAAVAPAIAAAAQSKSSALAGVTPVKSLAFYATVAVLFIIFSRVVELMGTILHITAPLAMIASVIALLIITVAGLLPRVFRVSSINLLLLFSLWLLICLPFG